LQIFALRGGRRRDDIDVIVGVAVFDHLLTDLRCEGRIVGNNCDMSAGVCLVAEIAGEGKQRTHEQRQGDGGDLKARPRICSRYSRFAMRSMLRMSIASHSADEDFFERRLDEFEAVNGGDGCCFMEEFCASPWGLRRISA